MTDGTPTPKDGRGKEAPLEPATVRFPPEPLTESLPALTVWQPWAGLIIAGVKRDETRVWPPPLALLGHPLLIHSGSRRLDTSELPHQLRVALQAISRQPTFVYGALLGTVLVVGASRLSPEVFHHPATKTVIELGVDRQIGTGPERVTPDIYGDFAPGRWIWHLSRPIAFDYQPAWKGGQRIFAAEIPIELVREIRRSYAIPATEDKL